jgi:hypothetical protein
MVRAMKSRLILLLLAAHAGAALAQYKCTAADGKITFQQTPCVGARSEEKLDVIPNGHPPGAPGQPPPAAADTSPDRRLLARYQSQAPRDALAQELRKAQDAQRQRAVERAAAVAAARQRFGDAAADAPALKDALADIDSRYTALGEVDEARLRRAQAALDDWDHAQAMARASAQAR